MKRVLALAVLAVCTACTPEIPDATYVCTTTAECPPGLGCDPVRGLCVREVDLPDAGCTPLTCETVRAECGELDDGCSSTLSCGTCTAPETCGGDGSPNICGCTPRACVPGDCGVQDNGCGALMDCGGCDLPFECGRTEPNRCGCTPNDPCGLDPKTCGEQPDGCGGTVTCNVCEPPETCGGGGEPNSCGEGTCVPTTCAAAGADCGTISDGCGNTLNCGMCSAPQTCGGGPDGGADPNRCGCTPRTCATTTLVECGMGLEECGRSIDCGSCPTGSRCNANRCECDLLSEPNDLPADATTVTLVGNTTVHSDQNVHVATDTDFLTFAPSLDGIDHTGYTVSVSVPSDFDLGVWFTCTDASATEVACPPGTVFDTTYPEAGCVKARGTTFRTVVSFYVSCRAPTFLVRVTGPVSCAPYDVIIDLIPSV